MWKANVSLKDHLNIFLEEIFFPLIFLSLSGFKTSLRTSFNCFLDGNSKKPLILPVLLITGNILYYVFTPCPDD